MTRQYECPTMQKVVCWELPMKMFIPSLKTRAMAHGYGEPVLCSTDEMRLSDTILGFGPCSSFPPSQRAQRE